MKKKIISLVVIVVLLLSILTACQDDGERLNFGCEDFFTVDSAGDKNFQGGSSFGKYLFQFRNDFSEISVVDLDLGEMVCVWFFDENELYHCNNVTFSSQYYDENDEFPLLYISMENINVHCALVYRITRDGNLFNYEKIFTVTYPKPEEISVYYPNCVIDADNDKLYVMGYTKNSYKKSASNSIRIMKFDLPKGKEDVTLSASDILDSFEIESITATQGAFIKNGKLYQVFSTGDNPSLRILDLEKKEITAVILLNKYGFKGEPESLTCYNHALFCCNGKGKIYKFTLDDM